MPQFRKAPIEVEARQVTRETAGEVADWCGGSFLCLYGRGDRGEDISHVAIRHGDGYLRADLGDWVVKESDGAFYPCTAEIFPTAFQPVDLPVAAPLPAPSTDSAPLLASANPEEIVQTAQQLEILCARDPRHGPIYSELAISLRAIAERRRQS